MIEQEREKYEKIWGIEKFRKSVSPGEQSLKQFNIIEYLKISKVESVLDAGCGDGRFLKLLKKMNHNLVVSGIDIADNAIDFRLKDIFTQGCLWEEEPYKEVDAITCFDVLEHLPEMYIDKVLYNFNKFSRKLCIVSVCMVEDQFGKEINEKLHLTVKDLFWWMDKLRRFFKIDFLYATETNFLAICENI